LPEAKDREKGELLLNGYELSIKKDEQLKVWLKW
jgi:hypothetical protein